MVDVAGRALGSRYQLTERLGEGAMGEVWRARDLRTDTPRAAKLLKSSLANDRDIVTRFIQERSILLSLDHPGIVRVRDLVVEGEDLAIVMDLIEGGDLRSRLRDHGTLTPRQAVGVTIAVLDALAAAHAQHCLHRDIKPDNVLLTRPGSLGPADVRLTDFGIARLAQESTVQMTGLLGTPGYMPPELFAHGQFSAASDLYAVGVLLYELLGGRTPFAGPGTALTVGHRHVSAEPSDSNPAAAVLGETATDADIARLDAQFGLDRPVVVQYLDWLGSALRGDLGVSWFTTVPVADSVRQALPVDLSIAVLALLMAVLIGTAAGVTAAVRAGGPVDRVVTVVCSVLATLPPFVIGIALIVLLSVKVRLFPSGGYVALDDDPLLWLRYAFLPALALSLDVAAGIARQLRTSLVGALGENYALGAEMRGFTRRRVLFGHVLRNAVAPTLAVIGMAVPLIIGGAVMTEKLFNLPGIAQLSLQSAQRGDVPVVLGTLLVTAVVVLIGSVVINALQVLLDPAARRGAKEANGAGR